MTRTWREGGEEEEEEGEEDESVAYMCIFQSGQLKKFEMSGTPVLSISSPCRDQLDVSIIIHLCITIMRARERQNLSSSV